MGKPEVVYIPLMLGLFILLFGWILNITATASKSWIVGRETSSKYTVVGLFQNCTSGKCVIQVEEDTGTFLRTCQGLIIGSLVLGATSLLICIVVIVVRKIAVAFRLALAITGILSALVAGICLAVMIDIWARNTYDIQLIWGPALWIAVAASVCYFVGTIVIGAGMGIMLYYIDKEKSEYNYTDKQPHSDV